MKKYFWKAVRFVRGVLGDSDWEGLYLWEYPSYWIFKIKWKIRDRKRKDLPRPEPEY